MSTVRFTSDLHEGHKNIGKFRKIPPEFIDKAEGDSTLANSIWIDEYWRDNVRPRDITFCLGDNGFTEEAVDGISERPGDKRMVGGNHDDLPAESYLRAFSNVRGAEKRYGVWLTHIPVHPDELRGSFNVHGHCHYHEIDNYRYINVCCDNLYENIGRPMITLEELRQVIENRKATKEVVWL